MWLHVNQTVKMLLDETRRVLTSVHHYIYYIKPAGIYVTFCGSKCRKCHKGSDNHLHWTLE